MFSSWKNLAVAVAVTILASGAAFAKGPTGGGNSSRGPVNVSNFQSRSSNTGVVSNNSIKSLPISNANLNVNHNNNQNNHNTGINLISNKPNNSLLHVNTNQNHNTTIKHNGINLNSNIHHDNSKCVFKPSCVKVTWPKCDPCCHHKHWCDPVYLGWNYGYDYSCCRVVRCETMVVTCGGDLVIVGEGLNVPAAAIRIELNGMVLEGSIVGQEPNKMVIRMPSVVLEQPMLANVSLVLPNGQALAPITVTVFPAR